MRRPLLLVLLLLGATACSGGESSQGRDASDAPAGVTATAQPCGSAGPAPDTARQRMQADLDGDGQDDQLAVGGGATPVVEVQLAGSEPFTVRAPFEQLLAVADVDRDGRAEVFGSMPRTAAAPAGELRGGVFVLDGCALAAVQTPSGPLAYVYGSGPDRLQAAATVRCAAGAIEQVVTSEAPEPGFRLVRITRWALDDGRAQDPVSRQDRVADAQDPAQATRGTVACG